MSKLETKFKITHPFNYLYGKQFTLVAYRRSWRTEYVEYLNDEGTLASVPIEWTDVHGLDPYVEQSGGRAYHRVKDLVKLVDLLSGIAKTS